MKLETAESKQSHQKSIKAPSHGKKRRDYTSLPTICPLDEELYKLLTIKEI